MKIFEHTKRLNLISTDDVVNDNGSDAFNSWELGSFVAYPFVAVKMVVPDIARYH